MKNPLIPLRTAALVAALAAAGAALAVPASDVRFVSGGVTVDDFKALSREAKDYSVKLVFAARGSGAYLADVDVTLAALPAHEVVLEHRTDGPLLLAALPPGRYELTASFKDVRPGAPKTQKRVLNVPRNGRADAVIYFDTGDQVSDDSPPDYSTR